MEKKKKYYRCFSRNLKEFLEDNGEEVRVKGINPDDGRTFWLFERKNGLDRVLTLWSSKSNKK